MVHSAWFQYKDWFIAPVLSMLLKAVLLSLFVFPGSGHLFLKRYWLGGALMLVSAICLFVLLSGVYEAAQILSYKILDGEIALNVAAIHQAIQGEIKSMGNTSIDKATFVLIACWVIGVLDSYRIGAQLASQNKSDVTN